MDDNYNKINSEVKFIEIINYLLCEHVPTHQQ